MKELDEKKWLSMEQTGGYGRTIAGKFMGNATSLFAAVRDTERTRDLKKPNK